MTRTPLQPDIPTLARRRANELRDQAIADALAWLWHRLARRRRGGPAAYGAASSGQFSTATDGNGG